MSKSDISDTSKDILEIDSQLVDLSVKVSGTPYLATHDTRTSSRQPLILTPRRKSNEKLTSDFTLTHQTIATPRHKSTDVDLFMNETEPAVILQQQRHRMQAFVDVFFQCETV